MSKAKRKKLEWVELREGRENSEGYRQATLIRMYREGEVVMLVPSDQRGGQMMSFDYQMLKKALALFEYLPEHAEGMLR